MQIRVLTVDALVLRRHGSLDDVHIERVPEPTIGPHDVLVEIKAAALNRLDLWVVEGWRGLKLTFPHIMGCDGSGIVVEIGAGVTGVEIGDRVAINPTSYCGRCGFCLSGRDNMCDHFAIFGEHLPGFYCSHQAVPYRNLIKIPKEFPFESAAAASLVYVTAWHSLINVGRFEAGEDILILGAGGGVNTAYIDIARFSGARNIYVVGSNETKLEVARKLGANILFHRSDPDWPRQLYKLTDRTGVDVVVDNVGGDTFFQSLRALKKGGRLLTIGNTSSPHLQVDNRYIFGKHLQILGSSMGPQREYERVMNLVFQGKLSPTVDSIYPLKDGLSALGRLEQGNVTGKIVLIP